MGLLDWLRGRAPAAVQSRPAAGGAASANPQYGPTKRNVEYAQWVDPKVQAPAADWERRLYSFARRCTSVLQAEAVPLFQSKWPRDGIGTYSNAFWLMAVDVELADRSWTQNSIHAPSAHDLGPGYPPLAAKGEFSGHFRGPALLLTPSGRLCTADAEGFLTRQGQVDRTSMDVIFHNVATDLMRLRSYDWGWNNRGRWRRYPKDDLKAYGLQLTSQSIRFEERQAPGANTNLDGRGTSAALSNFVKTKGSTRWPRHFASFDY